MMRRDYIDTPRGQVHLRRAGAGPETILLLHQTASSGAMFERFADALLGTETGSRYSLLAPDTPGFGMSFTPADPYDLDAWAHDLVAVLDGLDITEAHVLGHHTGAAIGICVAAGFRDRVRTLTMIGALGIPEDERAAWHAEVTGMRPSASGAHLAEAWWQVGHIDSQPTAYSPALELQHREAVDKLRAGARWHEAYLTVFSTDVADRLTATGAPALLICGREDILFPYVSTTLSAKPGIAYVELDAGAYVLDQQPELVLEPLTEFLAAHSLVAT
jgi:pimeloyl-ACP methyl ester carboxylesterase